MLLRFAFLVLPLAVAVHGQAPPPPLGSGGLSTRASSQQNQQKLPACKLCRTLTDSFAAGMQRTARGKHDGGDAAWEEQKLGSYKRSEVRLVEIQESLCKDAPRGEDQCHALAETHESLLEQWWFRHQDAVDDLHQWLCVEQLRVCCPAGRYGADCSECSSCSGNGKCKGDGTRKGNGRCACDAGYAGDACDRCDRRSYEAYRDDTKLLCSACHAACGGGDAGCTGAGPKACRVCADGWTMHRTPGGGCVDVDECAGPAAVCNGRQFCVNSEGSFSCLECDRSCASCTGDGPDECVRCADGYELRDGLCKDLTGERNEWYANVMRYMTYLGLCLATCVIFQSNMFLASVIGLLVGVYISLAEYYLYLHPAPAGDPNGGGVPVPAMEELAKQMVAGQL